MGGRELSLLCACACFAAGCGRIGFDPPAAGDAPGGDPSVWTDTPPPTDPDANVQFSDLHAVWTTPEWTFWFWTASGVSDDLATLTFTVAESMVDAVNDIGSAQTTVYQGSALPAGIDLADLEGLIAGDCRPDTEYVALMVATDHAGRSSVAVAEPVRTQPEPSNELVVFRDADTSGYSIPDEFVRSTAAPYAGTHHYQWTVACPSPPCYEILRRQGLGIDLSFLDDDTFARAFVEFAAASNSTPPSPISLLRIWFGTATSHDQTTLFGFGGWSMRADNQYRVYQFPLAALGNMDSRVPLTAAIARQGMFEFGVSGEWSAGSVTRLDEWRLRW